MRRSILSLLLLVSLVNAEYIRDDNLEVVTDTKTKLMWQDNVDAKTIKKNWSEAIDYCENLTLGGYDDWHLPNNNELYCLADKSRYNPAIDPKFQNVVSERYWSSTTFADDTVYEAWVVNFGFAVDVWELKSLDYYVRCVRDANE